MTGWDRQINGNGDTVADAARDELENIDFRLIRALEYLDLIAACLVPLAFNASPDGGYRDSQLERIRRGGGRG